MAESVPEEEARRSALSGFGINGLLLKIRAKRRADKRKSATTSSSGGGGEPEVIHGNCLDILPTITEPHFLISDPAYNQGYHYNGYSDALPPEEYQNLLLTVFRDKPSVIILYPETTINLLGGGQLGECREIVSWVYPSNTARQHRLITWWNCKPDLSKLGQPYKNPNDRRIAARIRMGDEAAVYDWWEINQVKNVSKNDHEHPCPIPEELARRIILTTTRGRGFDCRSLLRHWHYSEGRQGVQQAGVGHRNLRGIRQHRPDPYRLIPLSWNNWWKATNRCSNSIGDVYLFGVESLVGLLYNNCLRELGERWQGSGGGELTEKRNGGIGRLIFSHPIYPISRRPGSLISRIIIDHRGRIRRWFLDIDIARLRARLGQGE